MTGADETPKTPRTTRTPARRAARSAATTHTPASPPTRPARPAPAAARPAPVAVESPAPAAPAAFDTAAEATPAASLLLYLLRHADAGDPMAWTGDDAERPLSRKGRRQAKRLGRHLRNLEIRPDQLITSPKIRAAETASIVGKAVGVKAATEDRLAIDFGQAALAALVGEVPATARSVILVGHDPDFSDVATWLVGAQLTLRKGALALIELPDREAGPARGSLRWLLPPDAVAG